MKIDKEKFNKLKQLDRIEFRQKLNRIEYKGFNLINTIYYLLILSAIFLVGASLSIEVGVVYTLSQIANLLLSVTFFLIILQIMAMIIIRLTKSKQEEELFNEYFKVEIKK